jgi:glycerophosphoryl diester phosphodiesterase
MIKKMEKQGNKRKNDQLIIAHRGAMVVAPENTEAAFDLALKYPVDGFETDIQMTADNRLVICHDRTTKKFEKKPRLISELTLDEIMELDSGSWFSDKYKDQRSMTFEGFIEKYLPETGLMLELKSYPGDLAGKRRETFRNLFLETLTDSLKSYPDAVKRIWILSFDFILLSEFWRVMPGLNYVINIETGYECFRNPEKTPHFVSTLSLDINDIDAEFVNAARAAGRKIFIYSCNTSAAFKKIAGFLPDAIMTDDPENFFSFYS